jgi:hypothetical protein
MKHGGGGGAWGITPRILLNTGSGLRVAAGFTLDTHSAGLRLDAGSDVDAVRVRPGIQTPVVQLYRSPHLRVRSWSRRFRAVPASWSSHKPGSVLSRFF